MTRDLRARRNLPVDIDTDYLNEVARQIGATRDQYRAAYTRALQRTSATLRKRTLADMKAGIAPRSLAMVRRRLLAFQVKRGAQPDEFRLWFGLNAFKVKDLKGRIIGRTRPHHDRRDPQTGRFIKARRQARDAAFDPQGSLLTHTSFKHSEVARSRREGRRTIVIRDPQTRRTHEAEMNIYAPMLDYVEDNAFADAMEIFMHHFETDLRGRVKMKIPGRRR